MITLMRVNESLNSRSSRINEEAQWKTMRGAHILVDDDGKITRKQIINNAEDVYIMDKWNGAITVAKNNKTGEYEEIGSAENTYHFKLQGSITANSTCALIPQDYKNIKNNLDEKITLDGYPLCSWNNDVYANWLAQNQNTLKATKNCAIVDGVQSLINKNIGGVVGTFEKIYQQNASIQDKATLPNHAEGNINDGNFNVANKLQHFTIRHCVITREYAEKIDDFFTMYGYKINKVDVPNIYSRKNHNYIKTVGCHITGVDQEVYTKAIEQMFDNGITFWHNTEHFGYYNVDNSPK